MTGTAVVNGYVIEGHVPGMEGASKEPYDVLTFDRAGHTRFYAHR